jgi:putative ABC transport system permease protein
MFRNYLLIAWRNLKKNRVFSFINILGLAIGMAACLLIVHYVRFQLSYDRFHAKAGRVYRATMQHTTSDGVPHHFARNFAAVGPALQATFPGIEAYARLRIGNVESLLSTGAEKHAEEKIFYADSAFFGVFSFPLRQGDLRTALAQPSSIVLTETTARKYFGNRNPMGKTLHMLQGDSKLPLRVTGVLADLPPNSHLQFPFLISFETMSHWMELSPPLDQNWAWNDFHTYLLLAPGVSAQKLESQFPSLIEKQKGGYFREAGVREEFFLQPLADIYLHSNLIGEAGVNGNGSTVYFLLVIAFFITAIAWVNYINLSTVKAMERAKEVGVRKVSGAGRTELLKQFLLESLLLNGFGLAIAITLVQLSLPAFAHLVGEAATGHLWQDRQTWLLLASLFLGGTLVTGLYPALLLSSFQPVAVLKGKFVNAGRGAALRKGLVVFQFAASIALIIGTFTVYRQLQLVREADLGMHTAQTLVVKAPIVVENDSLYQLRLASFQAEAARHTGIEGVTATVFLPGGSGGDITGWGGYIRPVESQPTDVKSYNPAGVDYQFFSTFGVKVLAGRTFSEDFTTDRNAVVLTQTAARQLGYATPGAAVGKKIYYPIRNQQDNQPIEVIGVVNDIRYKSAKKAVDPVIFHLDRGNRGFYAVRLRAAGLPGTIASLREQYEAAFPGNPFEYFFLNDHFDRQYRADGQFGQVFGLFAALAVFIACLGLFGLASFTIVQRTKEIGVRKVLGASEGSIILLLSRDFAQLVLVASLIAWPAAYLVMKGWLQEYAVRIEPNAILFVGPALLVLLIALATIGFQTLKTARANPVNALRTE